MQKLTLLQLGVLPALTALVLFFTDTPLSYALGWITISFLVSAIAYFYNTSLFNRQNSLQSLIPQSLKNNVHAGSLKGDKIRLKERNFDLTAKLIELRDSISLITKLNKAIELKRYGQANQNILGASRIAAKNGEKLLSALDEITKIHSYNPSFFHEKNTNHAYNFILQLFCVFLRKAYFKKIKILLKYRIEKKKELHINWMEFENIFNNIMSSLLLNAVENSCIEVLLEEDNETIKLSLCVSGKCMLPENIYSRQLIQQDTENTVFSFNFIKKRQENQGNAYFVQNDSTCPPRIAEPKKPSVLVVEDDGNMQDFLKASLSAEFQVITANEGLEALEILNHRNGSINGVISDLCMPRFNGLQLVKAIRAENHLCHLPFMAMTGEVRATQRLRAFETGVDDYIVKPFLVEELLSRFNSLLTSPRKTQAAKKNCQHKTTAADFEWLQSLEDFVLNEIGNRKLNLMRLASEMAVSERQLFRKIKELTKMTPNKYVRELKLARAKEYLETYRYGTISEVAYAVGFDDPYYFVKIYLSRYKKRPSEYLLKK